MNISEFVTNSYYPLTLILVFLVCASIVAFLLSLVSGASATVRRICGSALVLSLLGSTALVLTSYSNGTDLQSLRDRNSQMLKNHIQDEYQLSLDIPQNHRIANDPLAEPKLWKRPETQLTAIDPHTQTRYTVTRNGTGAIVLLRSDTPVVPSSALLKPTPLKATP